MIHRTKNICFPRSGHHALSDVLLSYFGDEMHYCEFYLQPEKRINDCPETNFEKNHDFELGVPFKPEFRYLVQIRNPIDALASWKAMTERTSGVPLPGDWTLKGLDFWAGFAKKWVFQPIAPPKLVVTYERMLQHPFEICTQVIQFLTGVQNVDSTKLRGSLANFPIYERIPRASTIIHDLA